MTNKETKDDQLHILLPVRDMETLRILANADNRNISNYVIHLIREAAKTSEVFALRAQVASLQAQIESYKSLKP